jgi:hypothetical protein
MSLSSNHAIVGMPALSLGFAFLLVTSCGHLSDDCEYLRACPPPALGGAGNGGSGAGGTTSGDGGDLALGGSAGGEAGGSGGAAPCEGTCGGATALCEESRA